MPKKTARRADGLNDPELDEQIARMRELLQLMGPETGSSALGAIRRAFPDAPLAARVGVLSEYRRQEPDAGSEPSGVATGRRSASA